MGAILVVDDEPGLRGLIEVLLRRDGHAVRCAASGAEALALAQAQAPDLVLTDLRMDGMDGLDLLERLRGACPDAFVVVMTAFAGMDVAVRAMRLGAYNFLAKPFDNAHLRTLLARGLAARERHLAARAAGEGPGIHLIGAAPAMAEVQRLIEQVATTDSTVLITGESGTGKELVARALHYAGLRADGPLVRINCGALTPSLLESELFGHVRGAFTGAIEDRPGLFALAHAGTLFLDEVGELATETQVKLLRVLESGEYLPVGGREIRTCDVRVVAATNRDLAAMVQAGTFREDLFYRLAVIPIPLPPLRARREDIPLIAGHLLARHAVKLRRGVTGFAPDALAAMQTHPWPGNVRELDNCIQRGVALTSSGDIPAAALFGVGAAPTAGGGGGSGSGADLAAQLAKGGRIELERVLADTEKALLAAALQATGDNLTEAADRLGITFRQIRYRVKQLGLR
jgi:DNA-binding NtrC family response regulator